VKSTFGLLDYFTCWRADTGLNNNRTRFKAWNFFFLDLHLAFELLLSTTFLDENSWLWNSLLSFPILWICSFTRAGLLLLLIGQGSDYSYTCGGWDSTTTLIVKGSPLSNTLPARNSKSGLKKPTTLLLLDSSYFPNSLTGDETRTDKYKYEVDLASNHGISSSSTFNCLSNCF